LGKKRAPDGKDTKPEGQGVMSKHQKREIGKQLEKGDGHREKKIAHRRVSASGSRRQVGGQGAKRGLASTWETGAGSPCVPKRRLTLPGGKV